MASALEGGLLSDIRLTLIRHRGTVMPLGRNAAFKLLLDKSKPKKVLDSNRLANAARNLWTRNFHDKRLSYADRRWMDENRP